MTEQEVIDLARRVGFGVGRDDLYPNIYEKVTFQLTKLVNLAIAEEKKKGELCTTKT